MEETPPTPAAARPAWTSACGSARLLHADAAVLLPQLARDGGGLPGLGLVDLVLADPPYSSGGQFRGDRMTSTRVKYQSTDAEELPTFTGDNRDALGWLAWSTLWLAAARDLTAAGGLACIFCDWRQLPATTAALQSAGWVWRGIVPWDKINARPQPRRFSAQCEFIVWGTNGPRNFDTDGATYHPGLFRYCPPPTAERVHSTEKPVPLMRDLLAIIPEGAVCLDPFAGSGSAGVAALQTRRKYFGLEIGAYWFDVALDRLNSELNRTPLFHDQELAAL